MKIGDAEGESPFSEFGVEDGRFGVSMAVLICPVITDPKIVVLEPMVLGDVTTALAIMWTMGADGVSSTVEVGASPFSATAVENPEVWSGCVLPSMTIADSPAVVI